ncbi:hypothetical protein [Methylobacterium sp. E-066]|uniref:hypothetical protein n=1 Tax=Methylobacterium sp. E-066 TaxID=2836584 RepID=UPI001FB93C28|nr:hypothetical protein [Methylobacterium sp. E-066]MCJ2144349.1 hypothetical protein [Methylobacterium sp. E-066]
MHRRSPAEPNLIVSRVIGHLISRHPQIRNSLLVFGPKRDLPSYVATASDFGMECHISTVCATLLDKLTSLQHIILVLLLVEEIPRDVAIVLAEACEWIDPFYVLQIYKRENTIIRNDARHEVYIHSAAPVSGSRAAARVSLATAQLFHPSNTQLPINSCAPLH